MAVKAGKGAIRRLVFAFVSCLAPCLGPGTAAAFARVPDSARLDRMQHIDSVVVVGTFLPEKVIPAQVLSGERLQRLNAHSVADAIRYFSGVQIKDYGGARSTSGSSTTASSWATPRTDRSTWGNTRSTTWLP